MTNKQLDVLAFSVGFALGFIGYILALWMGWI